MKHKRATGFMEPAIWQKTLNNISTWDRPVTLAAYGAGEPLLYPMLFELLQQAKQMPHVSIGFMTNGMLLTQEWVQRLIDLQVDWVAFSIDGVKEDDHNYYRVNADLRRIQENIFRLIHEKEIRKSNLPVVSFNMVGYPPILDQTEPFVEKWLPHAGFVSISKFRPMNTRKLWHGPPPVTFHACPLLYRQFCISVDGRVGLCCEDIHVDVVTGNILDRTIESIFNESGKFLAYRQKHEHAQINDLLLCHDCDAWAAEDTLRTEKVKFGHQLAEKITAPAYQLFRKVEQVSGQ